MNRFKWLAMTVLSLLVSKASACYGGLLMIPTTDIVPKLEYSIELQFDGPFRSLESDTRYVNTQFGLADGLEAGLDFDISRNSNSTVLLNAKYVLPTSKKSALSYAIGLAGVTQRGDECPYVVASCDLKTYRLHAGAMRIANRERCFFGADTCINDRISLSGDWTDGKDNYSSVAFNYQFTRQFGIMAGLMFPNDGSSPRYSIHLVLCGP